MRVGEGGYNSSDGFDLKHSPSEPVERVSLYGKGASSPTLVFL